MISRTQTIDSDFISACNLWIMRETYRLIIQDTKGTMDLFYSDIGISSQTYKRFMAGLPVYILKAFAEFLKKCGLNEKYAKRCSNTDFERNYEQEKDCLLFIHESIRPFDWTNIIQGGNDKKKSEKKIKETLKLKIKDFKDGATVEPPGLFGYWSHYSRPYSYILQLLGRIQPETWDKCPTHSLEVADSILSKQLKTVQTILEYKKLLGISEE